MGMCCNDDVINNPQQTGVEGDKYGALAVSFHVTIIIDCKNMWQHEYL